MIPLSDINFFLYAAKHYTNPCISEEEFLEDLARIKKITRLFSKYKRKGELDERQILNNIVILYNVFEHEALTRILAFKLYEYLHMLKPFLLMLNYLPEVIEKIGDEAEDIYTNQIVMDQKIIEALRAI